MPRKTNSSVIGATITAQRPPSAPCRRPTGLGIDLLGRRHVLARDRARATPRRPRRRRCATPRYSTEPQHRPRSPSPSPGVPSRADPRIARHPGCRRREPDHDRDQRRRRRHEGRRDLREPGRTARRRLRGARSPGRPAPATSDLPDQEVPDARSIPSASQTDQVAGGPPLRCPERGPGASGRRGMPAAIAAQVRARRRGLGDHSWRPSPG